MMIATILAGAFLLIVSVLFTYDKLHGPRPTSCDLDQKLTPTQLRVLALHVEHASRFNI